MSLKTTFLKSRKVLVIGVVVIAILLSSLILMPLTIIGYAPDVPIQYGYDSVEKYWLVTSVISESGSFKMTLKEGSSDQYGESVATTKDSLSVVFEPLNPISSAPLTLLTQKYASSRPIIGYVQYETVPGWDVEDGSWLTQARYNLYLYKNGIRIDQVSDIKISYKDNKIVTLDRVTIENLGYLPQGVEVPSGDLVIIYDDKGYKHLVTKADLNYLVQQWNYRVEETLFLTGNWEWSDVWEWGLSNNILPKDVTLEHVSDIKYIGYYSLNEVELIYSGLVFAGMITLYIPADYVDTVITVLNMPNPVIKSVTKIPTLKEGDTSSFDVTVKNEGTEGTVSVTAVSTNYLVVPQTQTTVEMEENQELVFKFQITALSVDSDTTGSISILAQGRGGSSSETVVGKITDVEGYTPVIPEPDPEPPPDPVPPKDDDYALTLTAIMLSLAVVLFAVMIIKNKSIRKRGIR